MTDATRPPAVDMEQALLDPASVFVTPEALLLHGAISDRQKVEILRRWAYEASEVSVATEEGMPGDAGDLLHRILTALGRLGVEIDVGKVTSTKQHGIPRAAVKPRQAG